MTHRFLNLIKFDSSFFCIINPLKIMYDVVATTNVGDCNNRNTAQAL